MNKFKAYNRTKLEINYRGQPTIRNRYKGNFTRAEILQYTQNISNELKKRGRNGGIAVPLYTDDGWRGGYVSQFGENVRLYSLIDSDSMEGSDQKYYTNFDIIIFQDNPPTKGGTDNDYNDCLYFALKNHS